jgi:transcriptional regulator with XRE-family HTH domain
MLNFELIGKRFNELREGSQFTQSQIAEYLGVDQSYISKCEKNERQFSTDVLEKAAELFGCTIDYFIDESSEFKPMPIALRAKKMDKEDLKSIAVMNKIALNLRFMEGLLEENKK